MDNDFFKEIRNIPPADIRRFIEGCIVNGKSQDENGVTLLHLAANQAGNAKIAEVIISIKADVVHAIDGFGWTPLHYAMDAEIANVLISNHAKLDVKSNDGFTPLHTAVYHGKEDVVNFLIRKGADIKAKDNNGFTALHMSVGLKNVDVVKVLVEGKADVDAKCNKGLTPLDLAKKIGDTATLQYLIGIPALDEGFLDVLKKIVEKHGKGPLLDIGICRGHVSDYAKRDYKEESQCLFMAVEAGVSRAILGAEYRNLKPCLEQQYKKLWEEIGLERGKSMFILNMLGQIMWGELFHNGLLPE